MVERPSLQPSPDGQIGFMSATPSQSLSSPSQISGPGSTQPSQTKPRVPRQTRWPALHVPTPTLAGSRPAQMQVWPVWVKGPSSTMPLQLSSRPLHTSVIGTPPSPAWQTSAPPTQAVMPAWQVPMLAPQVTPVPGSVPSSTMPLQLSSTPLHTSCEGVRGMSQNAVTPLHATMPGQGIAHLSPTCKLVPESTIPSSIRPLQSSSMPLHTSGSGGHASGRPHALVGQPSSMTPSQLLSLQSPQTSAAQCLAP